MRLNFSADQLRQQSEEAYAAKKFRAEGGSIGILDCVYFVVGGAMLTAILIGLSLLQSL